MGKDNSEVLHRINYLYQAVHKIIKKSPQDEVVMQYYNEVLTKISKKTLRKINFSIKRHICKTCKSLLFPGITASIRFKGKNKRVILTCLCCKSFKTFHSKIDYQLWSEKCVEGDDPQKVS